MYIGVMMCVMAEFSTWFNSIEQLQETGKQIRNTGQLLALTTSIFVLFFVMVDVLREWSKENMGKHLELSLGS